MESIYHRQLGKIDFRAECLCAASFRAERTTPTSQNSYFKLKVMVGDVQQECQHNFLIALRQKRPGDRHSNPSRHSGKRRRKTKERTQAVVIRRLAEGVPKDRTSAAAGASPSRITAHLELRGRRPGRKKHVRKTRSISVQHFPCSSEMTVQIRYDLSFRSHQQDDLFESETASQSQRIARTPT